MKNLDIDSENTNISIDASQRVKIEFIGGSSSETVQSRAAVYTVIVPYSSFSKKLQAIHRSGGKITNISIPHFQLDSPKVNLAVELDEDTMPTLEEIPEPNLVNISEVAISTPKHEDAIAETSSEHVAGKTLEDELKEPVVNDLEEVVPVSKVESTTELPTPLAKSKKSSKSGSGFNKPKSYT